MCKTSRMKCQKELGMSGCNTDICLLACFTKLREITIFVVITSLCLWDYFSTQHMCVRLVEFQVILNNFVCTVLYVNSDLCLYLCQRQCDCSVLYVDTDFCLHVCSDKRRDVSVLCVITNLCLWHCFSYICETGVILSYS